MNENEHSIKNKYPYEPDFVSPPGATIEDILLERGMGLDQFEEEMYETYEFIINLLCGGELITEYIAKKLEKIFNVPAEFWLAREKHYRDWEGYD